MTKDDPSSTDGPTLGRVASCLRAPGIGGRVGRILASGLVAWLAVLHGQLLWQRIASFTLFEPWVAVRWGVAALLLAGFAYFHRMGVSVIWGNKALVLWLLVLLCHAGTVVPAEGHQPIAEPGLLLAISFWSFALRAILGDPHRIAGGAAPIFPLILAASPAARPHGPGFFEPLSPRPPPAA